MPYTSAAQLTRLAARPVRASQHWLTVGLSHTLNPTELHDHSCLPTRYRLRDIEHRCGVGRARRAGPPVAVRRLTLAAVGGVRWDRDRAAVRLGRAPGWVQPEPVRLGTAPQAPD